jgi:hypothetical protein
VAVNRYIAESIFGPSIASRIDEAQYQRDRYLRDQVNQLKREWCDDAGITSYMTGATSQHALGPAVDVQVKPNKKLLLLTA